MGNKAKTENGKGSNVPEKSKYDQGYKKEFSKKEELIHFLRKYVKAPWAKDLKPEDITLCDKEFGRHVLDFEYYLVDLSQIEEEDILSTNTLMDNIMALDKNQSADDFTKTLKLLAERITELPKADQADFIDWMENVMLKRRFPKDYIDNFNRLLREGGFQNMITYSIYPTHQINFCTPAALECLEYRNYERITK